MPAELDPIETPVTSPPPAAPAIPSAEPDLHLDTAFSDAAAAQRSASPPPAQQPATPETPVTPAAAAAPSQPAAPAINASLLSRAQAARLPLDGIQTDADLAMALMDHVQQMTPYAQLARQQLAQQPAQPEVPAKTDDEWTVDGYFSKAWQTPEWKPEYDAAIERGLVELDQATGLYVSADPRTEAYVLPILQGLNAAHMGVREARQAMFEGNPYRNIYNKLEEPLIKRVEQMIADRFGSYAQTQQQETLVSQFEASNASWMMQGDKYTPQGEVFIQTVEQLRDSGVTDPAKLLSLAMRYAGPQANSAPPPAAPAAPNASPNPAAPPAGERQRDPATGQFLPAGQAAPAAPAAPPPSKQEAFLDRARERAGHSPSRQSHEGTNPDDPVLLEQGDLDTFFTRAHRERRQAAHAN